MSSLVKSHFHRAAGDYAHFVAPCFQVAHDYVVEHATDRGVGTFLDIACGDGRVASDIRTHTGARTIGLDCSAALLEMASWRCGSVSWVRGDAHNLPFASASAEMIACSFGIRLFNRPLAALREMRRVCGAEGEVIIVVIESAAIATGSLIRAPGAQLEDLLAASGLRIASQRLLPSKVAVTDVTTLFHIMEGEIGARPYRLAAPSSLARDESFTTSLNFHFLAVHCRIDRRNTAGRKGGFRCQ